MRRNVNVLTENKCVNLVRMNTSHSNVMLFDMLKRECGSVGYITELSGVENT